MPPAQIPVIVQLYSAEYSVFLGLKSTEGMRSLNILKPLRVLYVENDPVLRRLVGGILQNHKEIFSITGVPDSHTALLHAKEMYFDVALLDYSLGKDSVNGVELGRQIRILLPEMGIVIFSQHRVAMFQSGEAGQIPTGWSILQKKADIDFRYLIEVMRETARGKSIVDPIYSVSSQDSDPLDKLTSRQLEIIALAATGVDASVIALEIGLAAVTVRQELSKIYSILIPNAKPGTDLRTSAVMLYLRATIRDED